MPPATLIRLTELSPEMQAWKQAGLSLFSLVWRTRRPWFLITEHFFSEILVLSNMLFLDPII